VLEFAFPLASLVVLARITDESLFRITVRLITGGIGY